MARRNYRRLVDFPLSQNNFLHFLGDLLNEALPAMKLYIDYVNNFDEANQTYGNLAENKDFVDFMEDCKKKVTPSVDLPSLLITPIQRMPRYELLIRVSNLINNPKIREMS